MSKYTISSIVLSKERAKSTAAVWKRQVVHPTACVKIRKVKGGYRVYVYPQKYCRTS